MVFWILWPLQMHHWIGEAYMNQGMQIKDRTDRCEQYNWKFWPYPGDRRHPDPYYRLTVDQLYAKVYQAFDTSLAHYPFYMETYYIVGRYYIDGGSYDYAVDGKMDTDRLDHGRRVLLRDIYMNPNYKWAHNNLGVIYDKLAQAASRSRDYDLTLLYRDYARKHYEIALDIDPYQIFALFNLGNGYFNQGMALYQAGEVERASPFLASSRKYLETCLEVQPNKTDTYELLTQILVAQRDYVPMVKCLEGYFDLMKRLRQPVKDDFYYRTLGTAYLKTEEPVPANPAARPEGPVGEGAPPLSARERGARARDLLLEARRLLAAERRDSEPELARQLADAYLLLGDYAMATEEFQKVLEGGVRDSIAYFDIARLAARAGREAEAREFVRQALAEPEDRARIFTLITSDASLQKIVSSPWFEQLVAGFGLGDLLSATGETIRPSLDLTDQPLSPDEAGSATPTGEER